MKHVMMIAGVMLGLATFSWADMLIGWDGGITTDYAVNATGVSGNLWAGNSFGLESPKGSTDGTFGSSIPGADTDTDLVYNVRTATPGGTDRLGVQIVNSTGSDLRLDLLVFDYGRWWAASPQDITVKYVGGDLAVSIGTQIDFFSGLSALNGVLTDYDDFDVSLAGLADRVLAHGQQATFQLIASNSGSATASGGFDNIGLTGSVIPEPSTIGLIALSSGVLLGIRRRMLI